MGLVSLRAQNRRGYIYTEHIVEDLSERHKGLYVVQSWVEEGRSRHLCYHEEFKPAAWNATAPTYTYKDGGWISD